MGEKLALADISPPPEEAFSFVPEIGSEEWKKAFNRGSDAVEKGEVALLILNGGMATRFSGVVKGVDVDVLGRSFLFWKLKQVHSVAPSLPIFIMNSPFTDEVTLRHLNQFENLSRHVRSFVQSFYPRETPDGNQFKDKDGNPSMAGRGHGDMLESFTKSGTLKHFSDIGCRTLMVSNVDNLGAVFDPAVVGMHLLGHKPVTIEVARRKPTHKGGIIASVKGNVQVFEGFRWPEGLNLEPYKYFNTNTFYLQKEVLASPPQLPLHPVIKEVQGQKVVQMEKILGEITEFLDARFLVVPDSGKESRFIPVKTPQELDSSLEVIRMVLGKWNLLE